MHKIAQCSLHYEGDNIQSYIINYMKIKQWVHNVS